MKKIASLVLALMLVLSAAAMAESVPSKTTSDMVSIETSVENAPAGSNISIKPVDVTEPAYQQKLAVSNAEVAKLAAAGKVADYFGEVKDAAGNAVSLTEMLGTQELNVFEFFPLVASGFEESYGKVKTTMQLSTPYAKNQKVAVMIGLVTVDANGNRVVTWTALEGMGADNGALQVELTPEIMMAIQNGTALMAVVSK